MSGLTLQLGFHTLLQRTAAQTLQTAPSHGPRPFGSTCPDEMLMFLHCGKCVNQDEPSPSKFSLCLPANLNAYIILYLHATMLGTGHHLLGLNTSQLPILGAATLPQHPGSNLQTELLSCSAALTVNKGHGLAMEAAHGFHKISILDHRLHSKEPS